MLRLKEGREYTSVITYIIRRLFAAVMLLFIVSAATFSIFYLILTVPLGVLLDRVEKGRAVAR